MRSLRTFNRRALLGAGIGIASSGLLTGCADGDSAAATRGAAGHGGQGATGHSGHSGHAGPDEYVSPDGPEVEAAERARGARGPLRRFRLTALEGRIDIGAQSVHTWTYDGDLPGRLLRVTAGDIMETTLFNHVSQSTTVHWHGLRLRNDMDGAPDVTQLRCKPGSDYTYRFAVTHPGTYWYHPHMGVQLDRGLYGPLVVDDPREPMEYDLEWVIVLDDWLDGVDGGDPDKAIAALHHGRGGMSHGSDSDADRDSSRDRAMSSGAPERMNGLDGMNGDASPRPAPPESAQDRAPASRTSALLGGDPGSNDYPYYLINGRTADAPHTFHARPGDRIRIRIVNAGADTAFRVALGDHRFTVTHADGYPVRHTEGSQLLLGMGERYDVLVTAKDGVFPFVALPEGKGEPALTILRTGGGEAPSAGVRPSEFKGKIITAYGLRPDPSCTLPDKDPDRKIHLTLTGNRREYRWTFNGKPYDPAVRIPVRKDERIRVTFTNHTKMWHPVHVHGHTYAHTASGVRKDTTLLLPGRTLNVDFDADNPGLWMLHCHNLYHMESGMMTTLGYLR